MYDNIYSQVDLEQILCRNPFAYSHEYNPLSVYTCMIVVRDK
jgi:hypothetical protein